MKYEQKKKSRKVIVFKDRGTGLDEDLDIDIYKCPECGSEIDEDQVDCPECGAVLEWEEESIVEDIKPKQKLKGAVAAQSRARRRGKPPAIPYTRAVAKEEYECPTCGNQVSASAVICKNCGEEFE